MPRVCETPREVKPTRWEEKGYDTYHGLEVADAAGLGVGGQVAAVRQAVALLARRAVHDPLQADVVVVVAAVPTFRLRRDG